MTIPTGVEGRLLYKLIDMSVSAMKLGAQEYVSGTMAIGATGLALSEISQMVRSLVWMQWCSTSVKNAEMNRHDISFKKWSRKTVVKFIRQCVAEYHSARATSCRGVDSGRCWMSAGTQ